MTRETTMTSEEDGVDALTGCADDQSALGKAVGRLMNIDDHQGSSRKGHAMTRSELIAALEARKA